MDTLFTDTSVSLKVLTVNIQYMEQYIAELFYMHVLYIVCLINY
jgi:hypothetical protein